MESREEIAHQLSTVRDMIRWGVSRFTESKLFYGHGADNAWDEVCILVRSNLHLPENISDQILDAKLTLEERTYLLIVYETRIRERMPAAYLTGEAWFAGLAFKVDERVVVPRSPIAELIEQGFEPWVGTDSEPVEVLNILDLCTGSGCIGIACAYQFPDSQVDLVDVSQDALDVAKINITMHGLADRVRAIESDLFTELTPVIKDNITTDIGHGYDIIVSNPPYVDEADFANMPREFGHEPTIALTAGPDGLDFARRILHQACDYLKPQGLLVMEVGNSGMTLETEYPDIPFVWLEFEQGGQGVMVFRREELLQYQERFS